MPLSSQDVQSLVDTELERLPQGTRSVLESALCSPRCIALAWNYGVEDERFECWCVGEAAARGILLVYCEEGFGPAFPWGYVFRAEGSMGMDSQWHSGLLDAAIGAGVLAAPSAYEVPGPRKPTQ
jgi:hypothetical protein